MSLNLSSSHGEKRRRSTEKGIPTKIKSILKINSFCRSYSLLKSYAWNGYDRLRHVISKLVLVVKPVYTYLEICSSLLVVVCHAAISLDQLQGHTRHNMLATSQLCSLVTSTLVHCTLVISSQNLITWNHS